MPSIIARSWVALAASLALTLSGRLFLGETEVPTTPVCDIAAVNPRPFGVAHRSSGSKICRRVGSLGPMMAISLEYYQSCMPRANVQDMHSQEPLAFPSQVAAGHRSLECDHFFIE